MYHIYLDFVAYLGSIYDTGRYNEVGRQGSILSRLALYEVSIAAQPAKRILSMGRRSQPRNFCVTLTGHYRTNTGAILSF